MMAIMFVGSDPILKKNELRNWGYAIANKSGFDSQ